MTLEELKSFCKKNFKDGAGMNTCIYTDCPLANDHYVLDKNMKVCSLPMKPKDWDIADIEERIKRDVKNGYNGSITQAL